MPTSSSANFPRPTRTCGDLRAEGLRIFEGFLERLESAARSATLIPGAARVGNEVVVRPFGFGEPGASESFARGVATLKRVLNSYRGLKES